MNKTSVALGVGAQILGTHALDMVSAYDAMETSGLLEQFLSRPRLTQLGERPRLSKVGGLRMGSLSMAIVEFGGAMRLEADAKTNDYLLMSCLRGSGEFQVDDQHIRLTDGQVFFAHPCRNLSANLSPGCVRLVLNIGPDLMRSVGLFGLDEQIGSATTEMAPLLDQLQLILASQSLLQMIREDAQVSRDMENLLVSLLRSCRQRILSRPREQAVVVSRDVRRAEIFIRAHAQDPICLDDIVRVSGVSARALQSNFMRFRQTTPTHFLRDVRLEMAHKRLLDARDTGLVSNVALESGFGHLGRFSKFYRERYGESPSETLRRSTMRRGDGPLSRRFNAGSDQSLLTDFPTH
jgi:AraC-like DNA-binding protein